MSDHPSEKRKSVSVDLRILRMKLKFRYVFLFLTFLLYGLSITFTAVSTFAPSYTIQHIQFDTSESYYRAIQNRNLTFDNVSILPADLSIFTLGGYLITPTNPKITPMPGIVFVHGMIVNSEMMLSNAIDYASAGFEVLAIDLPGHGDTGSLWDFGLQELQAVWSAVDYLANQSNVDPTRIAVSGHSDGGIAVTRAGIFDKTPLGTGGLIKAVAAIYCYTDLQQTLESIIGTNVINDSNWGVVISEYAGCTNGVITSADVASRSVIAFINSTNLPNYLLLTGDKDELTNNEMQFQLFSEVTDNEFTVPQLTAIAAQTPTFTVNNTDDGIHTFANGTARKLVIEAGQDHVSEVMTPSNMNILINWLARSLNLNPSAFISRLEQGQPVLFYYYARMAGWVGLLVATNMLMLSLGTVLSRQFSRVKPDPNQF